MTKNNFQKGKIIIYRSPKNEIEVKVQLEKETVWLRQEEIARLFSKERSVIAKHINNIFKDKEVGQKSNVQKLHIANSDKLVSFYSLDVILAVGYRTNSAMAMHFRKWATEVLKRYLFQGYVLNQKHLLQTRSQLKELQNAIEFLQEKSQHKLLPGQEQEILNLLANYSKTLKLLGQYDKGKIELIRKNKAKLVLGYQEAKSIIGKIKKDLVSRKEAGNLFGQETDSQLEAILGNICQTFDRKEVYPSLEEKAAHLLYFVVKDHPFVDGNKRIASFLFIYFLDKNNFLYRGTGERKINDNALTTLTLLMAVSDPRDKDILIGMLTNLLS